MRTPIIAVTAVLAAACASAHQQRATVILQIPDREYATEVNGTEAFLPVHISNQTTRTVYLHQFPCHRWERLDGDEWRRLEEGLVCLRVRSWPPDSIRPGESRVDTAHFAVLLRDPWLPGTYRVVYELFADADLSEDGNLLNLLPKEQRTSNAVRID